MGWIELLVAVLLIVTIKLALLTNASMGASLRGAARMRHVADRRTNLAAETARFAESKRTVVLASQTAEVAVETIAQVTQAGHTVIASTAFNALEQIPLAKDTAKVVRGVHDSIVDGVYDSITALNKGIGSAIRRGTGMERPVTGVPVTRPDEDGELTGDA